MARFILLNGPPGIGKSTLAREFADHHPGTLNLDVDQLRGMVGGWRDRFAETGQIVRPLALSVAQTHLRDVIIPQFLGRLEEIERFEAAATRAGARFVEIVLMGDKAAALRRFTERGTGDPQPWHHYVSEQVRLHGGEALLARMYDQLADAVCARPRATVVCTASGAVQRGHRDLLRALDLRTEQW